MKKKYWWSGKSNNNNHYTVKLSQLKLELGLFGARSVVASINDNLSIQILTTKPSSSSSSSSSPFSLFSFPRTSKRPCTHTTSCRRFLTSKTPSLVWDTRDLCDFNLILKDCSCDISFHVLYGEGGGVGESNSNSNSKPKTSTVVGKVSMIVPMAELLLKEQMKIESNCHHHFQRKLPIRLKVNGLIIEATLSVTLRLLRSSVVDDDSDSPESLGKLDMKRGITGKVTCLPNLWKKNNGNNFDEGEISPYESDGSPVFDSDDSSNESTTSSGSSNNSGGIYTTCMESRVTFPSSETRTHLDTFQRSWPQLSRNRSYHGCNFKTNTTKQETLTNFQGPSFTKSDQLSLGSYLESSASSSRWEMKEISSRDGQSKVKTNVFFASFDQRSEKASGGSACTVLVAIIAHWLHSNEGMPTRAQFNSLITQGSSEWRKLCNNDYYSKLFPDKHFDLETVIDANLRPLIVLPRNSYTGFFSPEKFQCLKGAMSFDEIWNEIKSNKVVDNEPRIYIVSWNDHFFVLKVEADAYYIIDSLGERLFEGCQRGFILKFDDSCVMYGKEDERHEIVCRGKECCKEFIKRFLAAIPLRQLEKEEKKWNVPNPYLHRQLQIDFHFSSSLSSSSS